MFMALLLTNFSSLRHTRQGRKSGWKQIRWSVDDIVTVKKRDWHSFNMNEYMTTKGQTWTLQVWQKYQKYLQMWHSLSQKLHKNLALLGLFRKLQLPQSYSNMYSNECLMYWTMTMNFEPFKNVIYTVKEDLVWFIVGLHLAFEHLSQI